MFSLRHLRPAGLGLAAAAGVLLCGTAPARYMRVETEKVPVERLVTNLEAEVRANPKDAKAVLNLARAHAMAFARRADELEARKDGKNGGLWFGYEPPFVPFGKATPTTDEAKEAAAKAHLAKATALYDRAVKLAPDDPAARLGRAWVIEQSGDKAKAVAAYRDLIRDGWAKDHDLKALGLGGHTVTAEAAGYLVPLLDAEKDSVEIADLRAKADRLKKLPRPVTPIAVPLRDGLSAADVEDHRAAVRFDADGSGLHKPWTWINRDAAWLVYDPTGRGEVDSALQFFGSVTFWLFWENGYTALAALDDDRDGRLADAELRGLALWHDVNGNGVADRGEVRPLAEYGIVSVSCRHERDESHPDRIAYSRAGVTFRDGTTRPTFDLILKPW
jgi:tetratricopeptide (TPR) repeat protein